jgi:hypothetical protein
MKIGILDLDTKKEKMGNSKHEKFPNLACGKIFGFHKMQGHTIFYPYNGERVNKLYVSVIFSWSRSLIKKMMPIWEQYADEILIGGSGVDEYPNKVSKLPSEIETVDPNWTYDMYEIDYGIGFTVRGCHVGCGFCMVWRKEGLKEYRVSPIEKLINPRSNHLVLLNNNSFADIGFFDDVEEIKERKLTVNWNQANDITILTTKHAEALASVDFRNFNRTEKTLHFAFDQMIKTKIIDKDENNITYSSLKEIPFEMIKITEIDNKRIKVSFDMLKLVPHKIEMLREYGIQKRNLTFYTLIGYDTNLNEDLERFWTLQKYDANVYAMMFRDLNGKINVDGKGDFQGDYVKPFRDWVNGKAFRTVKNFFDFDRYKKNKEKNSQLKLF